MLSNILILVACALLSNCGGPGQWDAGDHKKNSKMPYNWSMDDHDPIFDGYLIGFPNKKSNIPIVFVDNIVAVGQCRTWTDGYAEIEINRANWARATIHQRQWLLWHEYNHCQNRAKHNNRSITFDDEICDANDGDYICQKYLPTSIMRWWLPHDIQIARVCHSSEIDDITKVFCNNLIEE